MNKKIFIGPFEIAGQYRNLTLALRKYQLDANYYTFYQNKFEYGGDIGECQIPSLMRNLNLIGKNNNILIRVMCIVAFEMLRFVFFLISLFKYDVYIFGFGGSLLRWNVDLPILNFFNKKIIANLSHGSDMRPPYFDGALMSKDGEMPSMEIQYQILKERLRIVRVFEKYSNVVIGAPYSSSCLAIGEYLDVIKIGRLCQAQFINFKEENKYKINEKIIILHAPSHAQGKGTSIIREAVNEALKINENVEYIELDGVSNEQLLCKLKNASLLIDQVYSDLPLSGLGMEAMVCGVPVLVSGYGLECLKLKYFDKPFPPVVICNPDQLEITIKSLIKDKVKLLELSKQGLDFVSNHWSIEKVGERYLQIINGDIGGYLLEKNSYCEGYGLNEKQLVRNLEKYIQCNGVEGLGLPNRTDLVDVIISKINKIK